MWAGPLREGCLSVHCPRAHGVFRAGLNSNIFFHLPIRASTRKNHLPTFTFNLPENQMLFASNTHGNITNSLLPGSLAHFWLASHTHMNYRLPFEKKKKDSQVKHMKVKYSSSAFAEFDDWDSVDRFPKNENRDRWAMTWINFPGTHFDRAHDAKSASIGLPLDNSSQWKGALCCCLQLQWNWVSGELASPCQYVMSSAN